MPESSQDADRVRRLRAARETGHIPVDLLPWLLDLAQRDESAAIDGDSTPLDRLTLQLGDEIDTWMTRRGVTHRTIPAVNRRTLSRCLKGKNVTLATIADVADALDCDAVVTFHERGTYMAPKRQ